MIGDGLMKAKRIEETSNFIQKKSKKKKMIIIGIIVAFLVIIGGVGTYFYFTMKPKTDKVEKKEKKKVEEKEEEPARNLSIVDLNSTKRPIAVMIDNNTGRNNNNSHAGLQDSYLNYEIIVEGGLTRIMALFKDKDIGLIGPVRSSRHYFLDYALESDAIYAHYGWSTYAESDIKNLGVNNLNGLYLSAPYWRDTSIAAPHNVFTSIERLYTAAENASYSTTSSNWLLLNYSFDDINLNEVKENIGENSELIVANTIRIPYSNYQMRSYQYSPENRYYLRFMNGNVHNDKITHEQLHYKNIIIQKVVNSTIDSYGRQDLSTTGNGTGYYITNGYAMPIQWSKSSRSAKTIYTYNDGRKVEVNDGNTFIQIQPTTYNPEFE